MLAFAVLALPLSTAPALDDAVDRTGEEAATPVVSGHEDGVTTDAPATAHDDPLAALWAPARPGDIPVSYTCNGLAFTLMDLVDAPAPDEISPPIGIGALFAVDETPAESDWRVATVDDAQALLVRGIDPQSHDGDPLYYLEVARSESGLTGEPGWSWAGEGDCQPIAVFRKPRASGGYFRLDRRWSQPGPSSKALHLKVWASRDCRAEVQVHGDPVVAMTPDAVLVAVPVRNVVNTDMCDPGPPARVTVRLPEPLGDRAIYDMDALPLRQVGATATSSRSAEADAETPLDLLAQLETEEVEPGVLRILSDGHRDLSGATAADTPETYAEYLDTHVARNLVVGRDGRAWVIEPDRLFWLGSPTDIRWPQPTRHVSSNDLEVSPDGRLWRLVPIRRLQSFGGETWRRHLQRQVPWSVEMEPDGTLWATWTESGVCFEPEGCTPTRLGRRDREGWSIVDIPKLYHYSGSHLAVTGDGEAWTCCKHDPQKDGPGLLRFDGRRWHVEQPPTGVDADMLLRMDAADDGTLWLRRSTSALERYRDGAWTVFTEADGVPPLGYTGSELQKLAAAPDGGVWVTPSVSTGHPDDELKCDGVAHFDGSTWTRYLRDTCIFSMDVAPDGTLWVQAAVVDIESIDSYRLGETVEPVQSYAIRPGGGKRSAPGD